MIDKKFICDRCGREKKKQHLIDVPFNDKVVKDVGWITVNSKSGYSRSVDLCDSCLQDFKDWFLDPNS